MQWVFKVILDNANEIGVLEIRILYKWLYRATFSGALV